MDWDRRKVTLQPWLLATVVFLCFATGAFADVTMQLTAPPPGPYMAGIYISPYHANIDGVSTLVVCDDFSHDTFPNESWTASVADFNSLGSTQNSTFWNLTSAQQTQLYDEAAWLTLQLLSLYSTNPNDTTTLGEISFAIWNVFDSSAIPYLASHDGGAGYENCTNGACYWQNQAINASSNGFAAGEFANFQVYSPSGNFSCPSGCPTTPPQEFLAVTTPEPPAPALLAVYLSGLVGLVLLFRRRIPSSKPANSRKRPQYARAL
jgi:hypothetical protein